MACYIIYDPTKLAGVHKFFLSENMTSAYIRKVAFFNVAEIYGF